MVTSSSVLGAVVVVGSSGDSPRLMVDRIVECIFIPRIGGGARMLTICLFSSFGGL